MNGNSTLSRYLELVPHHQMQFSVIPSFCWDCRIYQLHLWKGVRPSLNKSSDSKAPALEISGMWSTSSLPLLPGPLGSGVVVLERVLSIGQIEQPMCVNKWLMLNCDCYITILETIYLCAKKRSGLFKNVIYKMCLIYTIIYKQDLALNNL